jgi:membrane protease YdiL (CAAX protease family)
MLPYYAYLLALDIPLALLLIASILWLRLEKLPLNWQSLKDRFRLKPMSGKDWLWSIGIVILASGLRFGLVSLFSSMLISNGWIPVPDNLPAFISPISLTDPKTAYETAVGGLKGNWLPVIAFIVTLFFNIIGEEFWWRGVVLPRQELAFGQWTWIIHGFMWAFFHIFKWWDVLNLIPICLGLSYMCTRKKSTTPGIVIHTITNGIGLLPLIAGVIGLVG